MAFKQDGAWPWGTRVLAIKVGGAGAAVNFLCDNFSVQQPSTFIEQRDNINQPGGGVYIEDFKTGSATIQLKVNAVTQSPLVPPADDIPADAPMPRLFDMFAEKVDPSDAAATNWIIHEISLPEEKGALKKMTINFRKAYVAPLPP